MIGDNQQLYYVGSEIKEDMKRELVITQEELDAIVDVQNEMNERGITYLIVISPDMHNVYIDEVPSYYKTKWDEKSSAKEQILEALKEKSNVNVLDLTDALIAENKVRETYLSTDSHWNYNGSFVGYQEIIKSLQKMHPDLPMYNRDDFVITDKIVNKQNLANMLSLGVILYDKGAVSFSPEMPGDMVDVTPNYPDPNWYSPAFEMIVTENSQEDDLPVAILYRDSFAGLDDWTIGNLNRFLNTSFSRFASYSTHQIDFNYIDTEKADVVIFELLESNIKRLGTNYLDNLEVQSDKPLYRFNTPLNGEWYVE